jgi:hypothetical protein
MFIKINNKTSISYIADSSIIRITFSNSTEGKVFCDVCTTELVSGTTHNYADKTSQTTSCSKSLRVFKETNEEAYNTLKELVEGK